MADDWFESLAAMEFLGLATNTMVASKPLSRFKSGMNLVHPKTVYQFPEAVVVKSTQKLIWEVLTRHAEDGVNYELVGKEWDSLKPYKFVGSKDEIGENFMILKDSEHMVHKMAKNRAARVKAGIK
jgi:hypothetical protein